ncbi:DUF4280 domain-containing protein [Paenibacillus shenyangensis]|uniref:DUF4280 domain-containing protein n=1 Tax=Paenibacillus sp. A9 TaxID=1284352 RepID=UPI0003774BD1|nr:DUF4280 domain-containing protein [Paenibacillus sp. A9]
MADEYYVVRGASMRCSYGSHPRKINLSASHGSFVKTQPMMNEDDYKPENVASFGVCSSSLNPSSETIYLVAEGGGQVQGKPCLPQLCQPWMMTKEKTRVEGKPALTTSSCHLCMYKGSIKFETSGQE